MSNTQRIRFSQETWRKGTRGLTAPHATDRPAITNMRLYADGLLGPRPLWQTAAVTIDAAYDEDTVIFPCRMATEAIDPGAASIPGYLALTDGEAKFYRRDTGALFSTTAAAGLIVRDRNVTITQITDRIWLVGGFVINTEYYSLDVTPNVTVTNVETTIASTFGHFGMRVTGSELHQGRAFYWGEALATTSTTGPKNRVYYSDSVVTNGDTAYGEFGVPAGAIGAEQFFDVDGVVKGCVSVGPNLMIWTEDGRWTIMQGSGDPGNATFNYVGRSKIPADGRWPTQIDRAAVFLSSDGMSLVTINAGGIIDDISLSYLGFDKTAASYEDQAAPNIAASSLYNSTLIPSTTAGAARHNWQGVWIDEVWDADTNGGEFQIAADEIDSVETLDIYDGSAWRIYERPITNEEPSRTAAGDFSEYEEDYNGAAAGAVTLPRVFDPTKQVRIKRVIIDGVTWSSDGTDFPAAALTASVSDGKANTTELVLGPGADPLAAVPEAERNPIRLVATGAPTAYTSFCDVSLVGITGLAIEAVTVEYEISEGPIQ